MALSSRLFVSFVSIAAIALTALAEKEAWAGGMDLTPERLVVQPPDLASGFSSCQAAAADPRAVIDAAGGAPRPGSVACRPNNAAFRNLVGELGFAIAPSSFHPARTTGYSGFVFSLEASFAKINSDTATRDGTKYWELGTRGSIDPNKNMYSVRNTSPDSILQIYALKVRKGLPLGFEVASAFGYIAGTSMWTIGGDLRWSPLEGFRTGFLGYLPDLSVGGGIRTLIGSSKMYLTTVGIDAVMSKPFTIAQSAKLTPFIGYQRLLIFGNSTILDLTPNTDAVAQCGYRGANPTTGAPECANSYRGQPLSLDFNNNSTFSAVRLHRNRLLVGANYNYEILHVGAQFASDITSPKDEGNDLNGGAQWTLSLEGGVSF